MVRRSCRLACNVTDYARVTPKLVLVTSFGPAAAPWRADRRRRLIGPIRVIRAPSSASAPRRAEPQPVSASASLPSDSATSATHDCDCDNPNTTTTTTTAHLRFAPHLVASRRVVLCCGALHCFISAIRLALTEIPSFANTPPPPRTSTSTLSIAFVSKTHAHARTHNNRTTRNENR